MGNCVIGHGMSEFTKERLMECSDAFLCYSCRECGLIAIANEKEGIWACRGCSNTTNFAHIQIPYASKLLMQELETMCIGSRLITNQKLLRPAEVIGKPITNERLSNERLSVAQLSVAQSSAAQSTNERVGDPTRNTALIKKESQV